MAKNFCDLSTKKAVVVGGSGGIGQAIARGLAEAGAQVMIFEKCAQGGGNTAVSSGGMFIPICMISFAGPFSAPS